MDLLKVLLMMYAVILFLNTCISAFFSHFYKDKLHRLAFYLWLGSFINFSMQGVFQSGNLQLVLTFSTYFICSILLSLILATACEFTLPLKKYSTVMAVSLLASLGAHFFGLNFTLTALPVAFGVAYPMFKTSIFAFFLKKDDQTKITKLYSFLLFLNALHFMDYPFLRENQATSIIGFSIALVLLVMFSILLPSFIIRNIDKKYAIKLEHEVKSRTEKLYLANSELQILTDENRSLLNIVCHDIGNPLQNISFGVENLWLHLDLVNNKNEEVKKSCTKIIKACENASEILNQVRALQAIKLGKVKMDLLPVRLDELIEELNLVFEDKLKSKEIILSYTSKLDSNVCILAEPKTLKNQVFNNLISNAIKFSYPKSEIKILAEDQGDLVHIQISDKGVGMSKEAVANVFNLDSATTQNGTQGEDGTGFGLPIVKNCLNKYDAEIKIESRLQNEYSNDHGTTFHIYFRKAS